MTDHDPQQPGKRSLVDQLDEGLRRLPVAFGGLAGSALRWIDLLQLFRWIALLGFIVLSGAAAAYGLIGLIESGGAELQPAERTIIWGLAVLAVVGMWLMIEISIRATRWRGRIAAFLIYLVLFAWSVSFGYGFYWKRISSEQTAIHDTESSFQSLEGTLVPAVTALNAAQGAVTQVQVRSQDKVTQENDDGGTCLPLISHGGSGPIFRTRSAIHTDVQGVTSALNGWLGTLPADSTALLQRAHALRTQPANQGATQVRVGDDPRTAQLRSAIQALNQDARGLIGRYNQLLQSRGEQTAAIQAVETRFNGGFETGVGVCRDGELAQMLALARHEIERLPPVSFEPTDPSLGADATRKAFFDLLTNGGIFLYNLVPFVHHIEIPPSARFTASNAVALWAAFVVDLLILGLTILGRFIEHLDRLAHLDRSVRKRSNLRDALLQAFGEDAHQARAVFSEFTIEYRGRHYLVATDDLPSVRGPLVTLQAVLDATAAGKYVPPPGYIWILGLEIPSPLGFLQRSLAERMDSRLERAAQRLNLISPPDGFARSNMSIMKFSSSFMRAALAQLLSEPTAPKETRERAAPAAEPRQRDSMGGTEQRQRRDEGLAPLSDDYTQIFGGEPGQNQNGGSDPGAHDGESDEGDQAPPKQRPDDNEDRPDSP